MSLDKTFATFANRTAKATGSPWAFLMCVALVVVWAASGPVFKFSETWQLVINTSTTIITFLMVFLIQNTQNRDGAAIQAKLDELILTSHAENRFIGIEKMTDKELEELRAQCAARAEAHTTTHERVAKELASRKAKTEPKAAAAKRSAKGRAASRGKAA